MLYGAPYDLFPPGRKVVGCIVLAGFSPFKYNTGYTRSLNWQNWFSVGPPSQLIPFHLGQRLMSTVIASKLKTLDGAQALLHSILYSKMGEEEKKTFSGWLETQDRTEEEFFGDMASGAMRSSTNWAAFLEVSDVLHSDWGFNPAELDDDHASKPMLVVGSEQDHLGGSTNEWIAENYRAAKLKVVPGGHISSLWHMDEIWREMIDMVNSK
ncbi:hypothetical protein BX600DRAFT_468935 [Xylariales sp. PMI_506]|nr:hypothetical protein BX600DRAFT_468935 [Xylariales sp. PMI_506]